MTSLEALYLAHDLASQNVLDERECDEAMLETSHWQQEAVNKVWEQIEAQMQPLMEEGAQVIVPDPNTNGHYSGDAWSHSFSGTVVGTRENGHGHKLAVVRDSEGDCFDVEVFRLTLDN